MLRLSRRLTNQRFPRWFSSSFQNKDSSPSEEEASTSSSSAEWIPPNSPLHGDRDHSQLIRRQAEMDRVEEALFTTNESDSDEVTLKRLEEALEQEERLEKERLTDFENENDQDNVDWLQTRRKVLGGKEDSESIVPVIHRQLFSEHEVVSLLQSFGGSNITVLQDDTEYSRMGGAVAMVLCTASNEFYVHSITKFLVDHMKERELHNIGVLGAQMGKHFLQANNRSNWNVVDCQNYIVHIFDQDTRHTLNLEALWSGKVRRSIVNALTFCIAIIYNPSFLLNLCSYITGSNMESRSKQR
jgi:ribosomal silencing factor RsfS